jgi:hypothetical protein
MENNSTLGAWERLRLIGRSLLLQLKLLKLM